MSFVKCASCGHRNSHSAAVCANCDAPLTSWSEEETSQALTPIQPYQPDNVKEQPTVHRDVSVQPHQRDNIKEQPTVHRDVPARRVASAVVASNIAEDELPYQTKLADTSLDFYQTAQFASDASTEKVHPSLAESEPWKTEKMPFGFSFSKPALSGTVIHIEARDQSSHHHSGLFSAIFAMFAEIVWIIPNSRTATMGQNDTERTTVTRIRIRTNARELKDAQLHGDPKGANLALGDVVSLWGRRRGGVLAIKKGYDHTSKSIIGADTKKEMILPALMMVALVLLILYLYPLVAHISAHTSSTNINIPSLLQNLGKFLEHK